jgi:hypothetical protein
MQVQAALTLLSGGRLRHEQRQTRCASWKTAESAELMQRLQFGYPRYLEPTSQHVPQDVPTVHLPACIKYATTSSFPSHTIVLEDEHSRKTPQNSGAGSSHVLYALHDRNVSAQLWSIPIHTWCCSRGVVKQLDLARHPIQSKKDFSFGCTIWQTQTLEKNW